MARHGVAGALVLRLALLGCAACASGNASAGAQRYEPLSTSVRAALAAAISDPGPPDPVFASASAKVEWLTEMSERLKRRMPMARQRVEFLKIVHYEAQRAGLDPHLVLGLIQVESAFRRYAVSKAGARGYMQLMPFWTSLIGDGDVRKLFDMRTNLRYGCVVLRHYLDIEKGNLYRALGRYNGSLGQAEYPNAVLAAWKKWER